MTDKFSRSQFEIVKGRLLARAPAKINLYLLVADKRPDGFHNIETLMSKITFYDELTFQTEDVEGIELVCDGFWSPSGCENLVYRAADLFYKTIDRKPEIRIRLNKNIPAGSGLGGASSDAATTLLALNRLYNQPVSETQLFSLAASLGSDVPFFLDGPQAVCTGRGEKIAKIDNILTFIALVILPDISVSTKMIYENFKPDIALFNIFKKQIEPIILQGTIDLLQKKSVNMLAKTCFAVNNNLALLKTEIEQICKLPVMLSGSGSALFVVLADKDYHKATILQQEIESSLKCNSIIVFNNQW